MSVQRGQVGKFKVLDFLDSAVLEHGQVGRGCRFPTFCSGQICFASKTCNWNPVQIGVAGQHLASESALGCFSTPIAVWDFGRFAMLQPCQVTALLGNKLETCSVSAHGSVVEALQICNILQLPDLSATKT